MKLDLDDLFQKRQSILLHLQSIDRLRRGSLSKQFFRSSAPGPATARGPYYLLQGFFHSKKFSERIPQDQAAQVEQDVENYRRFQACSVPRFFRELFPFGFVVKREAMARC